MMYLNRLVLRNFKKYRHAEIEFHGGLTGILGSNGSGKSTLVEAIAWALYGSRASGMNKEYIRNSRARESETVVVCLSMGLGRRELVIYRSMKGKNLSPEAVLMLDGRRIASGTREVDQRLEEMLKISYQDFMRTFYARQKDLDSLLREGGTGKREYLLKLLGLEDIRERALERIKADRTTLDDQRSRLAGALAEIGEVDERLREAAREVQIAEQGLEEARKRQLALEQSRDLRRSELEEQEEMRRSHELLCERKRSLEAQAQQRRQAIAYEARRLEEVRASRALLEGLQRPLSRLEAVMGRLDLLEPKRREHEEISRRIAAAEAALERERKALQESGEGLSQLKRDAQLFEELSAEEREYSRAEALMVGLERKRERHIGLQAELREELLRLKATVDGLVRVRDAIGELLEARARLEEILPSRDEASSLEREREILVELQERHRIREELSLRRREVQERLERLERERSAVSLELERLGDL
ncbi:MAG: SMC family ATPase, partial [Methanothrix sp.]|nr:SMC family ATPase [Methanothrix sp.]